MTVMDTSSFTGPGIDSILDDAKLLPLGGTTCDCYQVKLYGKLHFLKRLKPALSTNPLVKAAFDKEFETGYRLEHPNLVRYISCDKQGDGILMEYIDGMTLTRFVATHPSFLEDYNNARRFLQQLLNVVGYLHDHQVLHLDLKPDNILITRIGNNVKLIDLGFCYTDTYTDTMGRTDRFAAPEQLDGSRDVDARTDIYAIGRILQTLPCATMFGDIIDRCTRHDMARRYQSVSEILELLASRKKSARRWPWLVILAILLSLAGWGIYSYQSHMTPHVAPVGQQDTTSVAHPLDTHVTTSSPQAIKQPSTQVAEMSEALSTQPQEGPPAAPAATQQFSVKSSDSRAERLEQQVQGDIDDLYRMVRSGQVDPLNLMYMKQTLPKQIRELIELYRQVGNSEKVSEWYYKLDVVESVLSQIMS